MCFPSTFATAFGHLFFSHVLKSAAMRIGISNGTQNIAILHLKLLHGREVAR